MADEDEIILPDAFALTDPVKDAVFYVCQLQERIRRLKVLEQEM